MIVRRPGTDEREVVEEGALDVDVGLVGDNWKARGSPRTPDGKANPEAQITMINSRLLALLAQSQERWPLTGDQLAIDMDLSVDNLPPGTRLSIGSAMVEISAKPHTGCEKFEDRFGRDALRFISTPTGRSLRLRGVTLGSSGLERFASGTRRRWLPSRTRPLRRPSVSAFLAEGYHQGRGPVASRPGPLRWSPANHPGNPSGGNDKWDPVAPGSGHLGVHHEVLDLLGLRHPKRLEPVSRTPGSHPQRPLHRCGVQHRLVGLAGLPLRLASPDLSTTAVETFHPLTRVSPGTANSRSPSSDGSGHRSTVPEPITALS